MSKLSRIDCLLIQPPFSARGYLPHSDAHVAGEGVLSIATFLESNGFSSEVFFVDELFLGIDDFSFGRNRRDYSYDDVAEKIRDMRPRVVGLSALTPQYPEALILAELCKKVDQDIVTVMGGPHVSFADYRVFEDTDSVDVVVRGEGEWTMTDIVRNVIEGKGLDGIRGISYRAKDGNLVRNEDRPPGNLLDLPPVDYSKANPDYLSKCRFFLTFSRGCPFRCSYCVEGRFWGHRVRTRSVDAVLSEMHYLVDNFCNDFLFLGSVFNSPEIFFRQICAAMEPVDFGERNVSVFVSANHLPDEHLGMMRRAGVTKILMAVESASPEVLKRMNKKISFDLVVDRCRAARRNGLMVGTFWLFGHPGETEETARKSLDAMTFLWEEHLNDGQEISLFVPYPGLPMVQDPRKEGFRILTKDTSLHSRFEGPVVELDALPGARLQEIVAEARDIAQHWLSFYTSVMVKDNNSLYQSACTTQWSMDNAQ